MLWLHVLVLPQQSVATQVRVISPLQIVPLVTLLPQHASYTAGGVKPQSVPQITPIPGSQVIIGGVVSTTVTVWLHVALLLQQSTASHVRVMCSMHGLTGSALVTVLSTLIVT